MKKDVLLCLGLVFALFLSACSTTPDTSLPSVGITAAVNFRVVDPWQSGAATDECGRLSILTGIEYDGGYKFDPPTSQTATVDAFGNKITISVSGGKILDWSSNLAIGAVIVKAGTGANVFEYNPQATSNSGLNAFENKDISHITFCWQYQLSASKTAQTSYTRSYQWTIDKKGNHSNLVLSDGQKFTVNYEVKVEATFSDSDFMVKGQISIENNTPLDFVVKDVKDLVSVGIDAAVDCGAAFPISIVSGDSLTCTYETALPDKTSRVNTATITYAKSGGADRSTTAKADVIFGNPDTLVDECIKVDDDQKGNLGTVCAADAPKTFSYSLDVGPYACQGSDHQEIFSNTASFETDDTKTTASDSWDVTVKVPACANGCTLTQGYWRTHSDRGPAPYDNAWKNLGSLEEDTMFFYSGKTYYQVLWTPPLGNPYYILANQYIAAKLNLLNGADPTAISSVMGSIETFFNTPTNTPTKSYSGPSKNQMLTWAATLDKYNNGLIGPGHCSE